MRCQKRGGEELESVLAVEFKKREGWGRGDV
jgi:hypothetical protein